MHPAESKVIINDVVAENKPEITTNQTEYSLLRDSTLAKYAGNTATLFSVFDAIINCLTSRIESVDNFISKQVPFYVMGLYYLLPASVPLVTYVRNKWRNQPEKYDPDAIELLDILQNCDQEFSDLIAENPEEKNRILEVLTSYLRYEKNQPFNIVINLIFLTLRAAHGILVLTKGFSLMDKETNDKLNDWAALLSSISNMTYLAIVILHSNFQKYHVAEKRTDVFKNTLLENTFFRMKSQSKINNESLSEPLLLGHLDPVDADVSVSPAMSY